MSLENSKTGGSTVSEQERSEKKTDRKEISSFWFAEAKYQDWCMGEMNVVGHIIIIYYG